MKLLQLFACCCGILALQPAHAQQTQPSPLSIGGAFLLANPDARTSGMGDAATGLEPDANALFANAAKLPFAGAWGVSASYSPWMWDLNDHKTNATYVSAFKTWNNRESGGLSVKYFNYGDVTFRDDNGMALQNYTPREFAVDAAYARKLGGRLALSVSMRYIRSELGSGTYNGQVQKPASAVAGDVGLYYQHYADHLDYGNRYCWGISVTNLGSRLRYTDDAARRAYLPMNLRIGGGYSFVHTQDHQFTLAADINKLLVPTPPVYKTDGFGNPTDEIESGRDPDQGIVSAIFHSFADAPGGLNEELRELSIASGIEYTYRHRLFVRAGYFYEHPHKGHRQHFTIGTGVNFSGISIDVAYLAPTGNSLIQRRSMVFSLMYTPFREL